MGKSRTKIKGLRAGVYTLSENLPNFDENLNKAKPRTPELQIARATHQLKNQDETFVRLKSDLHERTNVAPPQPQMPEQKIQTDGKTGIIDPSLPQFPNYVTTQKVAEGGMGCVFRAYRQQTADPRNTFLPQGQNWVAIKTLPTHTASESVNPKAFRKALKSLKREFQIAKKIQHPNLINIYHFSADSSGPDKSVPPFLVMEWLAGKTLKEVLQQTDKLNKRLSQELCAGIFREVAKGLEAMHNAGIVHRDITPQNIMLTYDGRVKIIDFGISKRVGADPGLGAREHTEEITRSEIIKGKPCYISPEQIEGSAVSAQSDIFTLGIVLWELLTGRRLFHGDSFLAIAHQILECERFIKNPAKVSSRILSEWDELTMHCLARDPKYRFASAGELIYAVDDQFVKINSPLRTPQGFSTGLRDLMETLFEEEMVQELKAAGKVHLLSTPRPPAATTPQRSSGIPVSRPDVGFAPAGPIQLEAHPFYNPAKVSAMKRGQVLRKSNEQQWDKFRSKSSGARSAGRARASAIKTLLLVSVVVGSVAIVAIRMLGI